MIRSWVLFLTLMAAAPVSAQTTCGLRSPDLGVHVCFPQENAHISQLFHISAQINAPSGKSILGYTIEVDDRPAAEETELTPAHQLSVEANLASLLSPGDHRIKLRVPGIGETSVSVTVQPEGNLPPCDPLSGSSEWICVARRASNGQPGSIVGSIRTQRSGHLLSDYNGYRARLLRAFEALQLDSMEVASFDDKGNLYVASHAQSDIEVRKYAPGGQNVRFATVLSACGPGLTALNSIAVGSNGDVWIAGDSSACFEQTPDAFPGSEQADPAHARAFLARVNTDARGSTPLSYFSFLPEASGSQVASIRVDHNGNLYVAGTTVSNFPHQRVLTLGSAKSSSSLFSFVLELKPDGSMLKSALVRGLRATSLTIDNGGRIFIAGQLEPTRVSSAASHGIQAQAANSASSCCDNFIAGLSSDLSRISSSNLLPVSGTVSAIAASRAGKIILVTSSKAARSGIYALSLSGQIFCSERLPSIALPRMIEQPALDGFADQMRSASCSGAKNRR